MSFGLRHSEIWYLTAMVIKSYSWGYGLILVQKITVHAAIYVEALFLQISWCIRPWLQKKLHAIILMLLVIHLNKSSFTIAFQAVLKVTESKIYLINYPCKVS